MSEYTLRERKKYATRNRVQAEAIRLFSKHGYQETTVEQIAEAAEISPSTFFRYFPTKEAVVLHDSLDPLFIQAFQGQPTDISPIKALRNSTKQVLGSLSTQELAAEQKRNELIRNIPELRGAMLEEFARSISLLATLIAERSKKSPDDITVQTVAGAIGGVMFFGVVRDSALVSSEPWKHYDQLLAELDKRLKY